MTLIPLNDNRRCLVACSEDKINSGQCSCQNRAHLLLLQPMKIHNFNMFLDGGTILIETNLGDYSFDHRIGTTTPNAMYYGMPADDNENLLSEERVLEIKPQILEALKGYYKEFYQPTIDKFIAENS